MPNHQIGHSKFHISVLAPRRKQCAPFASVLKFNLLQRKMNVLDDTTKYMSDPIKKHVILMDIQHTFYKQ